jgi:MOSC domain-containing protein YiiM
MPLIFEGTLLSIHIAEMASVEMETLAEAELIAGVGIAGDRYATAKGTYSDRPHADRQVTLIEEETLVALKRDHDIDLAPEETRRNLVVRAVPLNHLVGRQFRVGTVLLFGGRLNVPCAYLDELLGKPLFGPLTNRSGLNCRIIEGGTIRPGDRIVPV